MPAFQERGNDIRWPVPWEHLSPETDWYFDCRERQAPNVTTEAARAAAADLRETIAKQPSVYWAIHYAQQQMLAMFGINSATALRLLLTCPGAAVPVPGVWCAAAAAPGWPEFKRRVRAALSADAMLTVNELADAVGADPGSVYAALSVLCRDRIATCIQDARSEPQFFCLTRPGGDRASYADLSRAHVASAPQPAA